MADRWIAGLDLSNARSRNLKSSLLEHCACRLSLWRVVGLFLKCIYTPAASPDSPCRSARSNWPHRSKFRDELVQGKHGPSDPAPRGAPASLAFAGQCQLNFVCPCSSCHTSKSRTSLSTCSRHCFYPGKVRGSPLAQCHRSPEIETDLSTFPRSLEKRAEQPDNQAVCPGSLQACCR